MPLFKKKEDEPVVAPVGDDKKPEYVTVESFNALNETIGVLSEGVKALNDANQSYQQRASAAPAAPTAPVEDPHKAGKERIVAIDTELDGLESKVDQAVYDGKGTGALIGKQRQLLVERNDLQNKVNAPSADSRIDAGFVSIDALSTEVLASQMPFLSIKEVKERYDFYMGQLSPEQKINTEVRKGCYNVAVGENQGIIQEVQKQEWLREKDEPATQAPTLGTPRGKGAADDAPPKPEDILSPDAIRSIENSPHGTPDRYYQRMGYEGWDDYYKQNKDYI